MCGDASQQVTLRGRQSEASKQAAEEPAGMIELPPPAALHKPRQYCRQAQQGEDAEQGQDDLAEALGLGELLANGL
jgi:hypothetical protein